MTSKQFVGLFLKYLFRIKWDDRVSDYRVGPFISAVYQGTRELGNEPSFELVSDSMELSLQTPTISVVCTGKMELPLFNIYRQLMLKSNHHHQLPVYHLKLDNVDEIMLFEMLQILLPQCTLGYPRLGFVVISVLNCVLKFSANLSAAAAR